MFKKVLIANRGEIAVRIVRACREMGIETVALYEPSDKSSLHVRLADECVLLASPTDFFDQTMILQIAQEKEADAIHPGYGFLAEEASFIRACAGVGIAFIGPPGDVVAMVRDKIGALQKARQAGFPTVEHSAVSFGEQEFEALQQTADLLGYPLVIKSCSGGRGAGEKLVFSPDRLAEAVRRAQSEAQAVYGNKRIYLEKAILPAHQVNVQIVGDSYGRIVHFGEREGSLQVSNRKLLEETPAPCLSDEQRRELWQTALALARLFHYQNVGTVEFLVDRDGQFYFTEFKSRLQVEHPLTEMITRVNLVQEQLCIAAGEPLRWKQTDIHFSGHALLCRIHAEDPWNRHLPSPGHLRRVRWAGGYGARVDTYVQPQSDVPAAYDPLIAKLTVWGADRQSCILRMRCALEDSKLMGTTTNLPLLQRILHAPEFLAGRYDTEFLVHPFGSEEESERYYQDLAAITAVLYLRRNQTCQPTLPDRLNSGWHRESRKLPQ